MEKSHTPVLVPQWHVAFQGVQSHLSSNACDFSYVHKPPSSAVTDDDSCTFLAQHSSLSLLSLRTPVPAFFPTEKS